MEIIKGSESIKLIVTKMWFHYEGNLTLSMYFVCSEIFYLYTVSWEYVLTVL